MKNFKKIIFLLLAITLSVWLTITLFFADSLYGVNESWFYWIELAFVVYFIWGWKLKSGVLLYIAFGITILGAAISIMGWTFSEQILRGTLAFWFSGIFLSLKELKE